MHKKIKRFGIDFAGYGLIILGLLIGWLPGPGGIPLILAGLGLLSVHNHWAKKILLYAEVNGIKFMKFAFPDNPWAKRAHDVFALTLIVIAAYLFTTQTNLILISVAIGCTALAIVDFLYNRNRLKKLKK